MSQGVLWICRRHQFWQLLDLVKRNIVRRELAVVPNTIMKPHCMHRLCLRGQLPMFAALQSPRQYPSWYSRRCTCSRWCRRRWTSFSAAWTPACPPAPRFTSAWPTCCSPASPSPLRIRVGLYKVLVTDSRLASSHLSRRLPVCCPIWLRCCKVTSPAIMRKRCLAVDVSSCISTRLHTSRNLSAPQVML